MGSIAGTSTTLRRGFVQFPTPKPFLLSMPASRPFSSTTIRRPLPRRRVHSSSSSKPNPRLPLIYLYTGLSLSILPGLYFLLPPSLRPTTQEEISPQRYTTHRISQVQSLSPAHVLVEIPVPEGSRALFKTFEVVAPTTTDGHSLPASTSDVNPKKYATIHHICVKSPDLQIERPYTPINDVQKDGVMKIVVKRVKGGEVGRHIHSLREGDKIEIRGPIRTCQIPIDEYDHITTISTGTGLTPFLQLFSKLSAIPSKMPRFTLLHYFPKPTLPSSQPRSSSSALQDIDEMGVVVPTESDGMDIAMEEPFIPKAQRDFVAGGEGRVLNVQRVRAGEVIKEDDILNSFEEVPTSDSEEDNGGMYNEVEEEAEGWWPSVFGGGGKKKETSISNEVKKFDLKRKAVMVCLPVKSLPPLVGPPPRGRDVPPLGGILGRLGFSRSDIWVL